jgi:hypothetical protein
MIKYILPVLLILTSCTTAKKVSRYNDEHPSFAASECLKRFLAKDTVLLRDSLVFDTVSTAIEPYIPEYINVPGIQPYPLDTGKWVVLRSILKQQVKCPPAKIITKTLYRDSIHYIYHTEEEAILKAKVKELEAALDNAQDENTKKSHDIESLQAKLHRCRKINLWLYIILGAALAYVTRKAWVKLFIPLAKFYPF